MKTILELIDERTNDPEFDPDILAKITAHEDLSRAYQNWNSAESTLKQIDDLIKTFDDLDTQGENDETLKLSQADYERKEELKKNFEELTIEKDKMKAEFEEMTKNMSDIQVDESKVDSTVLTYGLIQSLISERTKFTDKDASIVLVSDENKINYINASIDALNNRYDMSFILNKINLDYRVKEIAKEYKNEKKRTKILVEGYSDIRKDPRENTIDFALKFFADNKYPQLMEFIIFRICKSEKNKASTYYKAKTAFMNLEDLYKGTLKEEGIAAKIMADFTVIYKTFLPYLK